jgi:D-sedoheptulose 7-phosphate isomerase
MSLREYLAESAAVLEAARETWSEELLAGAATAIANALAAGKPLLVCGNGGSAADAMHVTGELVGRFLLERRALNVICLGSDAATLTSCANDNGFLTVFSRQVEAYGKPGAVLLGLSTSGNSPNVVAAFEQARQMGMRTVALTGAGGGKLAPLSDHLFAVPSNYTPHIQQTHVCLYHYLCQVVEREMAAPKP